MTYENVLATLRRIPAPIILAMATREFQMNEGAACVCGWALREALNFDNGTDANAGVAGWTNALAQRFGGTSWEWQSIYYGVIAHDNTPRLIEEAFTQRVAEAALGRKQAAVA